jgi:hypothetical protein
MPESGFRLVGQAEVAMGEKYSPRFRPAYDTRK